MKLTMETLGGRTITLEKNGEAYDTVYLTITGEDAQGNQESCHARLLTDSGTGNEVETLRALLAATVD